MRHALSLITFIFLLASCAGPKKSIYFQDSDPLNRTVITQKMDPEKEAIILPDDILAITITSPSSITEVSAVTTMSIFNSGGTPYQSTATLNGESVQANGYLVDDAGFIDFPFMGRVHLGGLTIRQAKDLMANKLRNYVKDPVVEIRIVNYQVTVLGEVASPGTIIAPNHKISVLDAIGAAGDITIEGRKDNVLVIRETEGVREFARLNLNSRDAFSSPYFYLKQNDMVIVEPSNLKRQSDNEFFRFYLPAFTSIVSTILAIYGIVQITK